MSVRTSRLANDGVERIEGLSQSVFGQSIDLIHPIDHAVELLLSPVGALQGGFGAPLAVLLAG